MDKTEEFRIRLIALCREFGVVIAPEGYGGLSIVTLEDDRDLEQIKSAKAVPQIPKDE